MENYLIKKASGAVELRCVQTDQGDDLIIATVVKTESVVVEIRPEVLLAERERLAARIAEIDVLLTDRDTCLEAAKIETNNIKSELGEK
jgi:hypothetical protein